MEQLQPNEVKESLEKWNKNLIEVYKNLIKVHEILDSMNKDFQEIYKEVQSIK